MILLQRAMILPCNGRTYYVTFNAFFVFYIVMIAVAWRVLWYRSYFQNLINLKIIATFQKIILLCV